MSVKCLASFAFASGASKNVFGTMHFRTMLLIVEV